MYLRSAALDALTVLMCDDTLGLADTLLGFFDDVVWCVVGEADYNGFLGSSSHSGSGEQCGQDRKSSEAHFEEVDRILRKGGERSLYQVRYSAMVVCCGVVDVIRKVPKWMPGV